MTSYSFTDIDPFAFNPYGGRPVSSHANSVQSFQLVVHWIQRCLTEHDDCRRAVCPYGWTYELDEGRWQSDSSCDGSDASDSLSQPPSKRVRTTFGGNSSVPNAPSTLSHQHSFEYPERGFQKRKGLLDIPIPTIRRSKSPPHEIEDGGWKFYHRSDSLKQLKKDGSVLLRDRTIPLLPTRYICVDSNPPRLCVAEPGSRGFYVALSHCWGSTRPLVTTTVSVTDRLKGIAVADMPQTFRDAVVITRELGIEYLWIDSLCILQGSKEDWQKESSKMGTVYGNAFLTISAAASTDSTQGIFRPRSVSAIPPVKIEPRDSDYASLFVAEFLENIPFEKPQPLDTRAWCLQETTLSPRVLIYGTDMLGWLCDSTTDVEHGGTFDHAEDPYPPLLAPRLHHKVRQNPTAKRAGTAFDLYHCLDERERATGRWAYIVNEFTRRKLTENSDRLPALSGLAKEIQLETGDEYLAGLWKKDLRHDLLWKVDVLFSEQGTEWKRPATYRAPTWSWASIEGPVTLDLKCNSGVEGPGMQGMPQKFQLLEAQVDPLGFDPLGEVSGGYLKLHAALRKVLIQERGWRTESPSLYIDSPWKKKQIEERYYDVLTLRGESFGRCCLDMPNEKSWGLADLWWLSLSMYEGLLITKGQKKGEYLRVGIVWFHDPANTVDGRPPEFSEEEYEEVILL